MRSGAYVDHDEWMASRPERQHLLAIEAAERAARGPIVLSHESAAVVWGMPLVGDLPRRVHITGAIKAASSPPVVRHSDHLEAHEITTAGAHLLTTPVRTAIDVASSRGFLDGVAVFDHARRFMDITVDEFEDEIARRRPFRGVRRAELALDASTGLSDSALESATTGRLVQLGCPPSEQQWRFVDSRGVRRRGDNRWMLPDGTISALETDGRDKYENPAFLTGRTPQQALWDEKQREDDMRELCTRFARAYWPDVLGVTGLLRKLDRLRIPHRAISAGEVDILRRG